jgi:ppGpp synthetase/RelA/SpoT-type nucleotidyltranferase
MYGITGRRSDDLRIDDDVTVDRTAYQPLPGEPEESAYTPYEFFGASAATPEFDAHRRQAELEYSHTRSLYVDFTNAMTSIVRAGVDAGGIPVHAIESRAKDVESFGRKAALPSVEDPRRLQFSQPLTQITDLAGVRVVTYFLEDVANVHASILDEFEVIDMSHELSDLGRIETFGYESMTYIVRMRPERCRLREYDRFDGLIGEVQVRTILQHTWAEIERGLWHRSAHQIPPAVRRRANAIAGTLEIADRELQRLHGERPSVSSQ